MKRNRTPQVPLSLFSFQDIITSVTGVIMLLTLLLAVDLTTRKVSARDSHSQEIAAELRQAIAEAENRLAELRSTLATRSSQDAEFGPHTQYSANAEVETVAEEISFLQDKIEELRNQQRKLNDEVSAADAEWKNRVTDVNQLEELREQRLAIEAEVTDLKNSHRVFYNNADARGRQVLLVELFESDILVAEAGKNEPPLRFSGLLSEQSLLKWAVEQSTSRYRFVFIVHAGTTHLFQKVREELKDKGFSIGFDLLPDGKVAIDLEHGAG